MYCTFHWEMILTGGSQLSCNTTSGKNHNNCTMNQKSFFKGKAKKTPGFMDTSLHMWALRRADIYNTKTDKDLTELTQNSRIRQKKIFQKDKKREEVTTSINVRKWTDLAVSPRRDYFYYFFCDRTEFLFSCFYQTVGIQYLLSQEN